MLYCPISNTVIFFLFSFIFLISFSLFPFIKNKIVFYFLQLPFLCNCFFLFVFSIYLIWLVTISIATSHVFLPIFFLLFFTFFPPFLSLYYFTIIPLCVFHPFSFQISYLTIFLQSIYLLSIQPFYHFINSSPNLYHIHCTLTIITPFQYPIISLSYSINTYFIISLFTHFLLFTIILIFINLFIHIMPFIHLCLIHLHFIHFNLIYVISQYHYILIHPLYFILFYCLIDLKPPPIPSCL